MPITLENLDEVFSYHQWSPEQVQKGNAIRAAAKELAKAVILSAPEKYDPPRAFADERCRFTARACYSTQASRA